MRKLFWIIFTTIFLITGILACFSLHFLHSLYITLPLFAVGVWDQIQAKQSVRRNFPLIGHGRYFMELIRPEINQYFIESNWDGMPFSREERSVVYQRAKQQTDTLAFGTQHNVYALDYQWINHSLVPKPTLKEEPRVLVGGPACKQPYSASIFNISAMSFGALSKNAIRALNGGAKKGGFYHNTGEGGLSPYHLEPGGDIVWQIGTGYFGARDKDGKFSPSEFQKRAQLPNVKMIEIKLSQGAKPGHGGILPARKVTPEIAEIRGVEMGKDVLSPPWHTAFSTPKGLLEFVKKLRELSGGKPVGFKLCIGKRREFLAIVKAMLDTSILPDYIVVDGGEGGTGAAPMEFSNSVGTPLEDGLMFVHNSLVGVKLRDKIRLIASGKVTTGFGIATKMALGADMCNSARGMMFALGCIQALKCNTNHCPVGVATQDPTLYAGLHVGDKTQRVANFHHATVHSFLEVIAAAGIAHPSDIRPWHIMRRVSPTEVKNYEELFGYLQPGSLLQEPYPAAFARPWKAANPDLF